MKESSRRYILLSGNCAGLALLLCSGCASVTPAHWSTETVTYEPVRASVQIDASAAVEASDTLSLELREAWKRSNGIDDAIIANYLGAVAQALRTDLATSGLFARISDESAKPDYIVKARCEESHPSNFRISITLTVVETATGAQVSSHTREALLSTPFGESSCTSLWNVTGNNVISSYNRMAFNGSVPRQIMAALKTDLAGDLVGRTRRQHEQAARADAELLTKASLSDLLAGSDKSVAFARARNRALIAAKNQQLPAILRDSKTNELSALVVKIEQTIFDLNHESEVAKDRAQQATANPEASSDRGLGQPAAAAGSGPTVEELRDLSISYRERIELLKPIAAALKEEIANRNR